MNDRHSPQVRLGWVLGALVMAALVLFLVTGGNLGGNARIDGDDDLPPIVSPRSPATGNVGSR